MLISEKQSPIIHIKETKNLLIGVEFGKNKDLNKC